MIFKRLYILLFFSAFFIGSAYITWLYYRYTLHNNFLKIQDISHEKRIKHLGIIMDGNRRWAKSHGYKPWIGHKKGVEPVRTALEFCIKNRIPYLTLYVFSLENFNRPQEELSYLFDVLAQQIADQELDKLFKEGIKVCFIGERSLFPEKLKPLIEEIESKTAQADQLTLNLLFCYGGQQEIVAACKKIASECALGTLDCDKITPELFSHYLWSGPMPPPDLIIRTAGDQRLSNFLTWASAYSELCFLPCFWPEITDSMLTESIEKFYQRKRTFGR
ncbi:MAG: di-trans,poly-cis-decaprenylcistransferase [Candidatus Babeliaceae bacterium]|nr:di-trans,poly-cis-decaprenylcistransferase [Candidatus Babeliaceae bacterium]